MTEETASRQTNKRMRFSETEEQPLESESPTQIHQSYIRTVFATLPNAVQSLCTDYCNSFVKLMNLQRQQNEKLTNLKKDDFIPNSARINFKLKSNKKVEESPEFKTYTEETNAALIKFQADLKAQVQKVVELEIKTTETQIKAGFCEAAKNIATILLIEENPIVEDPGDSARILALHGVNGKPTLLKHVAMDRLAFYKEYKTVHSCEKPVHTGDFTLAEVSKINDPVLATFHDIMNKIFVMSWMKQTKVHNAQAKTKAMEKFARMTLAGKKTTATAMEIDAEPSVAPQIIDGLIDSKVQDKTKALTKQIEKLTQQLKRAKNNQGAPSSQATKTTTTTTTGGAHPKKTTQTKKKKETTKATKATSSAQKTTQAKKTQHPKRHDASADAADSASSSSKKKQSKKQPPKKGKPSPKRSNDRSARSTKK